MCLFGLTLNACDRIMPSSSALPINGFDNVRSALILRTILVSTALPKLIRTALGGFLAVVLLYFPFSTAASTGWFARNWQSDKGLPNNSVFAIAQTSDGYLWLGTSVGLVAFDGNRFQR